MSKGAEGLSGGSTLRARLLSPPAPEPHPARGGRSFQSAIWPVWPMPLACRRARAVVEISGGVPDLPPVLRRRRRGRARRPGGHQAPLGPSAVVGRRRHLDLALLPVADGRLRLRRLG